MYVCSQQKKGGVERWREKKHIILLFFLYYHHKDYSRIRKSYLNKIKLKPRRIPKIAIHIWAHCQELDIQMHETLRT